MIKSEIEDIGSSQEEILISQFLRTNDGPINFEPLSVEDVGPAISELELHSQPQPVVSNLCKEKDADFDPLSVPSAIPWTSPLINMRGQYDFDIYFEPQKNLKGATWIYCSTNNKLFVLKDAPCPINFLTAENVPRGTLIRAQAFFSQPQYYQDNVQRCINHAVEAANSGIDHPDHLIRLENYQATYSVSSAGHRSVVIPFQKPPVGQYFSTHLFKFTCYSSCSGGMNRRPVIIVFTLEKDGLVLGKRCMDLKVCACPGRDYKHELKHSHELKHLHEVKHSHEEIKQNQVAKPEQKTSESVEHISSHLAGIFKFIENFKECDKMKVEKGPFTLNVDTYEDFITLRRMYFAIKFHRAVNEPKVHRFLKRIKTVKQDTTDDSEN